MAAQRFLCTQVEELCLWCAGSTQEEVSSIVEASIKDSKISGTDRPVAWDGATKGGQDLQNQVMCPRHLHTPSHMSIQTVVGQA